MRNSIKTRRKVKDGITYGIIYFCAFFTVAALIAIVGYILINGLSGINWEFLSTLYKPGLGQEGIWPMIVSTLMLIGLTVVIATPIGILSAIYLSEYAKKGVLLEVIRFATESLSGIPSIIYGLFGYAFFVVVCGLKLSILSGALTLSIMVLPIIIRTTEEALLAIPQSYREGSLALGAGKLTTILRVVLPSAIGGILTSVILSIGRMVGETAALIYTMGSSVNVPESLLNGGRTLSVHLYFLAKEGTDMGQSFATAAVLLILVAFINFLAKSVANVLQKRNRG
jgi:phosphate transport system permease protein